MHVSLSVSVCVRVCTCVRAAATGPLFDRLAREESERRGRMAPDPSHYDIINTPFKTEHHFFFFFSILRYHWKDSRRGPFRHLGYLVT